MALRVKNNLASVNTLRYLSKNQDAMAKSLERLASGQRINKGADDPAGLVISENLRSQIAGINQAVENSETSISMVQTAEGALTEVNDLLIQARQLALAAANEGANDNNSLYALQGQLKNALQSIDRVSTDTRFGNKTLLDGSNGIAGVANSDDLVFLGATVDTRSSPVKGYGVTIDQAPTRAAVSSDFDDDDAEELKVSVIDGGKSVSVIGREDETAEEFASKLSNTLEASNMAVDVFYDNDAGTLTLQHKQYGSDPTFQIVSSKAGVLTENEGVITEIKNGTDVRGMFNGEAATGHGRVLRGNEGNPNTAGLTVLFTGKETGDTGTVSVSQNSLAFQIGPDVNQQVHLAIEDIGSDSLARGQLNDSGFNSLADVNITTVQGAEDTVRLMDTAINEVSDIRGKLGAFQKNALETNTTTLRVTAENLLAAESSIRDADIAAELAEFTKNQILTQTAAAANAQANEMLKLPLRDLYQQ